MRANVPTYSPALLAKVIEAALCPPKGMNNAERLELARSARHALEAAQERLAELERDLEHEHALCAPCKGD